MKTGLNSSASNCFAILNSFWGLSLGMKKIMMKMKIFLDELLIFSAILYCLED